MTHFSREDLTAARALLLKHFPEVEWTDRRLTFHSHHLSPSWLTAGSLVPTAETKREVKRLERIESLTNELWREYHRLPLMLRSDLPGTEEERDLWMRLARLSYDLTGKAPTGSGLDRHMPPKRSALRQMRTRIEGFFSIHHTQRDNEIARKIHLAGHCYDLWATLKGVPAPKAPSPGAPFYTFVADVIEIAQRDWSVERTLQKYHAFHNNIDS